MLKKIPFSPEEHKTAYEMPGMFGGPPTKIRSYPVSMRENIQSMYYEKAPYWFPTSSETTMVVPDIYNINLGRGPMGAGLEDGHITVDSFGLKWQWVQSAGGATVHPGEPYLENANEWKDKIKIPDIDSWDWAGAAEAHTPDMARALQTSLINGFWFERLISFMDFAPAAMALLDEDQEDAIKELFEALTDLACKVVDKFCEFYPYMDGINVHDDWGAQKNPFFSDDVARRLFLPYIKELTGHIHSKGRFATLHSCGHIDTRCNIFVEGGFDAWDPMPMNDTRKLYQDWGDKIVISVIPDRFDPETTSEDEQRQRARDYVDEFSVPGKPAMLGFYGAFAMTPAFLSEMYEYSRKKFLAR
ncbi:MAG: methyltransferase [Eubacteriaceae bacterium]|nr:methyltransferase [Eubacteriaceae bacterium]